MSTTAPEIPFGTQLIGRTEKSLSALLQRLLADSGLSEAEYVAMRVCSQQEPASRPELEAHVMSVFRKGDGHAAQLLDGLIAAGIIAQDQSGSVELTAVGRDLRDRIAAETDAITARLWGDLPADDLLVAGRVLSTVLHRAASERA